MTGDPFGDRISVVQEPSYAAPKTIAAAGEDRAVETPLGTPKSYLTLSARPEDGLACSEGPTQRVERCVCGGEIAVWPWESIGQAIAVHQVTLLHETWRWKAGITESELRALWGDR